MRPGVVVPQSLPRSKPFVPGGRLKIGLKTTPKTCSFCPDSYNKPPVGPRKFASAMKRTVLVILSNRLNRNQKVRFLELECDDKGNVLKEHPLRAEPKEARFHEVWENDDGKDSFAACHRFKRKYRHRLEKSKA
jgi:hypothetical protein